VKAGCSWQKDDTSSSEEEVEQLTEKQLATSDGVNNEVGTWKELLEMQANLEQDEHPDSREKQKLRRYEETIIPYTIEKKDQMKAVRLRETSSIRH
jgi:hypothetical protein